MGAASDSGARLVPRRAVLPLPTEGARVGDWASRHAENDFPLGCWLTLPSTSGLYPKPVSSCFLLSLSWGGIPRTLLGLVFLLLGLV